MTQPTLANVPGILLRTVLRLVARVLFVVAGLFFTIAIGFALGSVLLCTWKSPRGTRSQLAANIILLATELVKDRRRVTKTDSH